MHVTYPKFKLGDEVVREVAVPPTYGELYFVYELENSNWYLFTIIGAKIFP